MNAIGIGALWFLSSALLSTWANSTFLKTFNDPLLHNFIRFLGSALLGFLVLSINREVKLSEITRLVQSVALPALLLFTANYTNSISLNIAGITMTYVVKACIPVFTVTICTFSGQKFPLMIYISLIPICLGIIMASGTDTSFSSIGFMAALSSSLAQAFMNIEIKSIRSKFGLSGPKAFLGMSIGCTLLALPFAFISFGTLSSPAITMYEVVRNSFSGKTWPLLLFGITAVGYYSEYVLNFIFVSYVSQVSFSVCDIGRRVSVIVSGSILFNKPLTLANWAGIIVALGGVLWYSYLEHLYSKKVELTPPSSSAAAATNLKTEESSSSKRKRTPRTVKKSIDINTESSKEVTKNEKKVLPKSPKKTPRKGKKKID
jgi:solute carrier family 35 protein E1